MDLSTIPLPEGRTAVTVVSHTRVYPTVPGCVTGVVHVGETDPRTRQAPHTVQCSVCLRTATGASAAAPIIHAGWNFTPDEGERGATDYRRCPDCRAARRHPAEQLDMLDLLEGAPQ